MKKQIFILFISIHCLSAYSQATSSDSVNNRYFNSAEKLLATDGHLLIGGYGEVHYNQPLQSGTRQNGNLDVHRMVMLFGYHFNQQTSFITEIEYEHVKEVYIEQAFLQHQFSTAFQLRAGLLLTPMGIINEYHEPTTFFSVERPYIDQVITPTTWREIGFGFTGNLIAPSIRYQAYLMNGPQSYSNTDGGLLTGNKGIRNGRQKGAKALMSAPNFTGKIEFYGIRGLNLGLSGYFGRTQSPLYDGIQKDDELALKQADSSTTGLSMLGIDARYKRSGWQARGQFYYSSFNNSKAYNAFAGQDIGSSMLGYYIEVGYDILRSNENTSHELLPFVRYSNLNTHQTVPDNITQNPAYNQQIITTGINWKLSPGTVLKTDIQFLQSEASDQWGHQLNAGVGVMF